SFVNRVDLGASVLISLRFEFANREVKSAFDANIDLDFVSLFQVEGSAKVVFDKFKDSVTLTIAATQVGGNVERLSSIVGGEGNQVHLIRCSLEDRESCQKALGRILQYVANDFPEQLTDIRYDPS